MHVLYDGQVYAIQTVGGVSRYFTSLINRLPARFMPLLLAAQLAKSNQPIHSNLKLFKCQRFRPKYISYLVEQVYFRSVVAAQQIDIAHPTYYTLLTRNAIQGYRCPVVLTVWDMIHERFATEMDATGQFAARKRQAILAAQAIVCISEHTKQDLLERYSLPESQITVTPLASELKYEHTFDSKELVPSEPYFLYVGSRIAYKNFDGLLAAFSKVVSACSEVILCIVGVPFTQSEKRLIHELKLIEKIRYYGQIGDSYLAKLYRCSIGLVYPSKYEGFGIPPLEAMSCKTAVIAANCSSLPEVVGDTGLLVNPNSQNDLAEAMLYLLNYPADRDRLIAKGYDRSKQFSWEKTAAQTVEVYHSLVG